MLANRNKMQHHQKSFKRHPNRQPMRVHKEYNKIGVLPTKPSLVQLACAYLLSHELEINSWAEFAYEKGGTFIAKDQSHYFFLLPDTFKIRSQGRGDYKIERFGSASDVILWKSTTDYLMRLYSENALIDQMKFIIETFDRFVFNKSSEHSYMRMLYSLNMHNANTVDDVVKGMRHEFDNLWAYSSITWQDLKKYKSSESNTEENIAGYMVATINGPGSPFLYRHLFRTIDVLIYSNKNALGVIINKRLRNELLMRFAEHLPVPAEEKSLWFCDGIRLSYGIYNTKKELEPSSLTPSALKNLFSNYLRSHSIAQ